MTEVVSLKAVQFLLERKPNRRCKFNNDVCLLIYLFVLSIVIQHNCFFDSIKNTAWPFELGLLRGQLCSFALYQAGWGEGGSGLSSSVSVVPNLPSLRKNCEKRGGGVEYAYI